MTVDNACSIIAKAIRTRRQYRRARKDPWGQWCPHELARQPTRSSQVLGPELVTTTFALSIMWGRKPVRNEMSEEFP